MPRTTVSRRGRKLERRLADRDAVDEALRVLLGGSDRTPPPLETEEAMTTVFAGLKSTFAVPSLLRAARSSFST